ncbi:MAG: hypothetical protein J6Y08_02035 [Clostridiales bacterium]|nr:hypothetical protein [Clostridiales bacterium]
MSEKDPNGKLPQAPILTPDILTPEKREPAIPSDEVASSKEKKQKSSENQLSMKFLIGSVATLLLACAVALTVLVKTGAFSKKNAAGTSAETTEDTSEETETTSSSDPTTESDTPHKSIISLDQISDKQFEFMDQLARDYIREDGYGIPDEVTIDGMYCIGMLRQCLEYSPIPDDEHDMVQLVYQVQVTDNTGDTPVKRQFFWMYGFMNVYRDGSIDPEMTEPMMDMICFDNWSPQGSLDIKRLLRQAENRCPLMEDGIDYSLIQPFEGEEQEEQSLVKSIDQITPAMEDGYKKGAEDWLEIGRVIPGAEEKGIHVDAVEYAGLIFTVSNNKAQNCVYVVYKVDITDKNVDPPESRTIYWYVAFGGAFDGGEIQTRLGENTVYDPWTLSDWADAPGTIEELREHIQHKEATGWICEDNLEKQVDANITPEPSPTS